MIGGSKLSNHQEHLSAWFEGRSPGPLVVEVAATHGCNHDCVHCGFQQFSPYTDEKTFINSEAFKRFVKDFKALGGIEIYFAGNGEPLLNQSLEECIRFVNGNGLDVTLSTNGILLTEQRFDGVLPFTKWIRFSVNGGNKKTYSKVHKCDESDFDILIKNIRGAVEYRASENLNVRLIIQFIAYEPNWKSLKEIVKEHHNLGTDLLIIRNATFRNGKGSNPPAYIIDALKEIEGSDKVQVRWETFGQEKELKWSRCYGINFRSNLDDRGNLFTCFSRDCTYGNINQTGFADIWRSIQKKEVFARVEQGGDIPMCKNWCPTAYDNVHIENYIERINNNE